MLKVKRRERTVHGRPLMLLHDYHARSLLNLGIFQYGRRWVGSQALFLFPSSAVTFLETARILLL